MGYTNFDTITVANGFTNSYMVSDGAYLYTIMSDFSNEPEPNGRRINMGVYGGSAYAATGPCRGDFDNDYDVDGTDLAYFANAFGSSAPDADFDGNGAVDEKDLAVFVLYFPRTDCPCCP